MINFNYYIGDAFVLYKRAVENKTDKAGKTVLEGVENSVESAYKSYDESFSNKNVHTLLPSNVFSQIEKGQLYGLYGSNKKIVKDIRTWIDNNNKRTYLRKCPYCTINSANTTEHILPKKKYPEYAVHAKNLLPCCSECNSKKGENIKDEQGKPIILNYYYDTLPNVQYLFVIISFDAKGIVDFEYRLDNRNNVNEDLFELIESHYNKLDLLARFKAQAINIYSEIENSILVDVKDQGVENSLQTLRNKTVMDAVDYGLNHWKVVLKLALADSVDYSEYIKKKQNL